MFNQVLILVRGTCGRTIQTQLLKDCSFELESNLCHFEVSKNSVDLGGKLFVRRSNAMHSRSRLDILCTSNVYYVFNREETGNFLLKIIRIFGSFFPNNISDYEDVSKYWLYLPSCYEETPPFLYCGKFKHLIHEICRMPNLTEIKQSPNCRF